MATMRGVSRFIAETLNDSVEFKDFVTATISDELTYLVYPDLKELLNTTLPGNYVSVATYDNEDERGVSFSFRTALFVTIKRFKIVKDVKIWEEPTFGKLESIALKAKEILKSELDLWGIEGDKNLNLDIFNMFTPAPMGEEGLQMQIDIKIGKDLFLC